jgi:hypothetical protein
MVMSGECDQIDIDRVHHQLDRHQNDHDVPAGQDADDSDRKECRSQK